MVRKFISGLVVGLGFALSVVVVFSLWDPISKLLSRDPIRIEMEGVEVVNRNIYVSGKDSIFAADFQLPILAEKFERYSLQIHLRNKRGAFIGSCYRGIEKHIIESQKSFPYTLTCHGITNIDEIDHVTSLLIGESD